MWRKFVCWSAVAYGALLASGCAGPKVFVVPQYSAPQKIAVLPMANETTDLDGPPYIRQLIFEHVSARGYAVVPLQEVDDKLKAQGFTEGGQLGAATPQKIGEWVGVDGLLYTTLIDFNYINLGYYWQRKVTVFGRLVRAATGETLWETERTFKTLNVVTRQQDAQKQFLTQIGIKAIEKMTHAPLQIESRAVVQKLIDTLPR